MKPVNVRETDPNDWMLSVAATISNSPLALGHAKFWSKTALSNATKLMIDRKQFTQLAPSACRVLGMRRFDAAGRGARRSH